jgi:hypothetical protein
MVLTFSVLHLLSVSILKMRATGFPEPLVNFYQTTYTAFCMAIATLT